MTLGFVLFLSFSSISTYAQEVEIYDVTSLTQHITGKDTKQQIALTKGFVESNRGSELVEQMNTALINAENMRLNESAKKAQSYMDGDGPMAELDKYYDQLQSFIDKDLANGDISQNEYKKQKAELDKMRNDAKKGLAKEMKNMSKLMGDMEKMTSGSKMASDPKVLLNDLTRYAVGGKTWKYISYMGKGLVKVSDGNSLEYSWGVMNVIGSEIFPQKYQIYDFNAANEVIILENDRQQRGLFRYDGSEVIAFNDKEMWLDLGHPVVNEGDCYRVLDGSGNLMFSYPEVRSFGKYWTVKGSNVKWGVVDDHGNVLVPIKYRGIFDAENNGKYYIGGYVETGSNDMDLYDPETWQMVGKRINQKFVMK